MMDALLCSAGLASFSPETPDEAILNPVVGYRVKQDGA
jgi:hypothetical protein